ncbi:MAG: VOC family protein [Saprospiraceae bacterium]|nr:VOC family protein [Saprospiraceae bacterium]
MRLCIPALFVLLAMLFAQCQSKSDFDKPIIQIGIVVSDLDRSLNFYKNVLGMQEVGTIDLDAEFGKSSGLTGGAPTQVQVLKLEDNKYATEWKLMSFDSLSPAAKPLHIQDGIGMRYATISVSHMKPFLDRLRQNNVPLLGDCPVELEKGRYFVLFQDPDGIFIELIGDE